MKKLTLLMALFLIVFLACTDDKEGKTSADDITAGGEYMYISDATGEGGGEGGSNSGGAGPSDTIAIQSGQITAGEWSDLENWSFWNNLFDGQDYSDMPEYWNFRLDKRISVLIENKFMKALCNVSVELINGNGDMLWKAKTNNKGVAELWPCLLYNDQTNFAGLKIKVADEVYDSIIFYEDGINHILINDLTNEPVKKADIAFVVDATGSMGDELEYLKVELVDVIDRVEEANANADIRTGTVYYRDEEDDFVTKMSDFTPDIAETIGFIEEQSAGGGGDFPEAVHTALNKAINNLQWANDATSKILFLLLDAPPHYESQIITQIHTLIQQAAGEGIRIIPITASGIDKETEFLMRYFAIATNGTYVFITDHSGIGNSHLEPSIGDYEVEYLNDLLVRLINEFME